MGQLSGEGQALKSVETMRVHSNGLQIGSALGFGSITSNDRQQGRRAVLTLAVI